MYIIHDGKIINSDSHIGVDNRAYQYGDALFETIKFKNGKALFINDHFERMVKGMNMVKLNVPEFFSVNFFNEQFKELALKNNCTSSARIRLQVYRDSNGYYLPSGNESGYSATASPLSSTDYVLNELPINIIPYTENKKAKAPLSNLKSANALLYIVASQYAQEQGFQDCFILNEDGNIAEAISSNIFILNNNQLFTPPLTDGGVEGIMQKQIIRIAIEKQIDCIEKSLGVKEVMSADEIILTNVMQGVRVVKCNNLCKQLIQRFIDKLNTYDE